MDFIGLPTNFRVSPAWLLASAAQRGTWLALQFYCATAENGGIIEDCKEWESRIWEHAAAVTSDDIGSGCLLYYWEDHSLHVLAYDVVGEADVKANRGTTKREAGRLGGSSKSPKKAAAARLNGTLAQADPSRPKQTQADPSTAQAGTQAGTQAHPSEGKGREAEEKLKRGEVNTPSPFPESSPPALRESSEVDPMLVEDRDLQQKKEGGRGGDPLDLIEYLGMAESHAKGNPDGFIIPPTFVRHWHDIRTAGGWEKASGQPVPNTVEARFADLKVMARAEHHQGRLQSFANGAVTPAQKKKEAAARMAELLARPPVERWPDWAREHLGWQVDDDAEWQASEASARKELWAAWTGEENRKKQAS